MLGITPTENGMWWRCVILWALMISFRPRASLFFAIANLNLVGIIISSITLKKKNKEEKNDK